ncbi:uncharacterized protein LOC115703146 isoform X1 [Cannabis sativa]|jgi:uncharacterized membrane protein YgcG|uniref:Uncharacterized protein n=2 Tax=Cannabis sativa TaxID=3483 RepID=A0A7J6E388_CANSA|nr:uncharacterized protein LOC115703146 isoform X1 [Cannabis sativa]XP_030486506.2 uncharacterized protein LOC115703146 isoform X1 [Cannabis sativa]KAF4352858.1 hypothetical protein G4B88_024785 [Cannabis sativa]
MRIVVLGVQKQMDKDSTRHHNHSHNNNNINNNNIIRDRERIGEDGSVLLRASSDNTLRSQTTTSASDFVLQWGNRKRLRCMKVQVKDDSTTTNTTTATAPVNRTTVRVDRRVVRADKDSSAYLNLRHRPSSPPTTHRILRNSESATAMRGHSNGGVVRGITSPDRGAHDKKGGATTITTITTNNNNHHHHHHHHNNENSNNHHHHHNSNINNKSGASSETAHDSKKGGGGGGGSSSGSGELAAAALWPPKFVIALTNKEKEEDFFAFKGSKLPQRPKKRSKFIQRTLNLVSPGAWLCDLTLERYEVREKKIIKKRPRGLKAMGNMESESE